MGRQKIFWSSFCVIMLTSNFVIACHDKELCLVRLFIKKTVFLFFFMPLFIIILCIFTVGSLKRDEGMQKDCNGFVSCFFCYFIITVEFWIYIFSFMKVINILHVLSQIIKAVISFKTR